MIKKGMLGNPLVPIAWSIHSYLTLLGWETLTNKNRAAKFIYTYSHHFE